MNTVILRLSDSENEVLNFDIFEFWNFWILKVMNFEILFHIWNFWIFKYFMAKHDEISIKRDDMMKFSKNAVKISQLSEEKK